MPIVDKDTKARIMYNIENMKWGVIEGAGSVERGERFIGHNIEVILRCLLEGKSEAETIDACEFIR